MKNETNILESNCTIQMKSEIHVYNILMNIQYIQTRKQNKKKERHKKLKKFIKNILGLKRNDPCGAHCP